VAEAKLNKRILSCRVALFTGAGASVPLGLPDTRTFISKFKQLLSDRGSGLRDWLDTAINAAGDADAETLLDAIEEWLTMLEAAWNVPAGGHQNELQTGMQTVKHFWEELRTELRRAVVETYGRVDPSRAVQLYRPLLLEFWSQYGLGRTLPVFTTNYDTAIETLAEEAGREIDFFDGFRHSPMGLRWEATEYHEYVTRRRKGLDLVLFKLHGSSNWYQRPRGFIEKMDNFELDPGNLQNIMIFPTQRKSNLLGNEPFQASYGYFSALLKHLRVLITIGFSFRDAEIRDMIWEALRDRPDFQLVVIDPNFTRETLLDRLSDGNDPAIMQGDLRLVQRAFGGEGGWVTIASPLGKALTSLSQRA